MRSKDSFHSFFQENKDLAKDYVNLRLEIYRLNLIRSFSRSAGYLIWVIISIVLLALFIVFAGIVTGLWLSELMGGYLEGFGWTTLLIVAVTGILALFRKRLFINPIIRTLIRHAASKKENLENKN
jgi:hypothetical protein